MTTLTKEQQTEVKKEVNKQVKVAEQKIEEKVEQNVERHLSKELLARAKKPFGVFGSEFKIQTATAIIAAFGFLIALSWKDLITGLVDTFAIKPGLVERYPYISQLYSVIIITAISVIGIALVNSWAKKPDN